jgi:RimJ/RimL family protein N-acetyltransferase
MDSAFGPFIFFQVSSKFAADAFSFHQLISSSNEHIWPRTEEQIKRYAESGELFAVRIASTQEFVGLCYVTLDETNQWEVGGVTVADEVQKFHLGSVLVRFALAHTIAYQRPWHYGQKIIAHVHEDNQKPRNLLTRIGFEFAKKVEVPGDVAPATMKRNAEGKVCGDEFEFLPNAVVGLQGWFELDSSLMLADGHTPAIFENPPGGLESIRESLREAADELRK